MNTETAPVEEPINPDEILITSPYDGHLHFREPGEQMDIIMEHSIKRFCGATAMTNLVKPVTTKDRGSWYRTQLDYSISNARRKFGADWNFLPVITCYLTDTIDLKDFESGFKEGIFGAAKLMLTTANKTGGTTNSHNAVVDIRNIYPHLEVLQKLGKPVLEHMEVPDPDVDEFDREVVFVEKYQLDIVREFPDLEWVAEHISTKELLDFVREHKRRARGTLTIQHAKANRNALFYGGLHPENWCKPILKREHHRQAVEDAMVSGEDCFGAGTDAALHGMKNKFKPCGSAGSYTANSSIEQYAEIFDRRGLLVTKEGRERFRKFLCDIIPQFYGITVPPGVVKLTRREQQIPPEIFFGSDSVIPFPYKGTVGWTAERLN